MLEKIEITPTPSEDELTAITVAIQSLLATYKVARNTYSKDTSTNTWRLSARWWSNKRFIPKAQFGPTYK